MSTFLPSSIHLAMDNIRVCSFDRGYLKSNNSMYIIFCFRYHNRLYLHSDVSIIFYLNSINFWISSSCKFCSFAWIFCGMFISFFHRKHDDSHQLFFAWIRHICNTWKLNSGIQLFLQLFSYYTWIAELFSYSVIQLFLQLFSYYTWIAELFSYSVIQLFNYSGIQLFSYSTIQLFNYSVIQLFNYSVIQLFRYSSIILE
jgi:hypothetical protein